MSTNTPLPVPSKAALRALRGIVFGTSCTLALVTEDRRRRINAARSAIHHANCIRSARRYHANSAAKEGQDIPAKEVPLETDLEAVVWREVEAQLQQQQLYKAPLQENNRSNSAVLGTELMLPQKIPTSLQHPMPSLAQQADEYRTRVRQCQPQPQPQEEATPDVIVAQIAEQTAAGDAPSLEAAVQALQSIGPIRKKRSVPAELQQALLEVSAPLCRACQQAGRLDLAEAVLAVAVQCEQLDEASYFAHDPLPVVDSLIPRAALEELKKMTGYQALQDRKRQKKEAKIAEEVNAGQTQPAPDVQDDDPAQLQRRACLAQLRRAALLFLPHFSGERTRPAADLVAVGQPLLAGMFAVGNVKLINSTYSAMVAYPGDMTGLSQWYLGQLHEGGLYQLEVWAFWTRPPAPEALSLAEFWAMGNRVVEAARETNSVRSGSVLRAMLQTFSTRRRLRTAWVTELLHSYWRATEDYAEVQRLFEEVVRVDDPEVTDIKKKGNPDRRLWKQLKRRVRHPDGVFRVMVQISLEAEWPDEAQRYFELAQAGDTAVAQNIRMLGLLALEQAREGDWESVWNLFRQAVPRGDDGQDQWPGVSAHEAERVFVPIVKEYLQTHTIGETEDLLRRYISELGVPVGREMVTLLAKEYGALREVHAFIGWLEFCAAAGFAVDAAFSNAILSSCHRHWKFCFRDLRTLFRKLRTLGRQVVDETTQRIMAHAAISDARPSGRGVRRRLRSLRLGGVGGMGCLGGISDTPGNRALAAADRRLDAPSAYLYMRQAYAAGHLAKTVRLYRQAVQGGMAPSTKHLQLAVAAEVQRRAATAATTGQLMNLDGTAALLQEAQAIGVDTDRAAAYVAIVLMEAESTTAAARKGREGAAAAVQTVLGQFEAGGVMVSDMALNRAAFRLFRAGHMRGALALALAAANTPVGGRRPGYNVWNFAVLAAAYSRLADAAGIRMAVEGAAASGVSTERLGQRVLKQARRQLQLRTGQTLAFLADESERPMSSSDAQIQQALLAIEEGLARAKAARRKLGHERRVVESAAVDIMRRAALEAGYTSRELDEDPWELPRLVVCPM